MTTFRHSLAAAAGAALIAAPQAAAAMHLPYEDVLEVPDDRPSIADNAENIQRLNIMLMVTSLRCRGTAHDFQREYEMFASAHRRTLEQAHQTLSQALVVQYGEEGSRSALDRIGVAIANTYGDGHPTLGCSDLKQVTQSLATSQDSWQLSRTAQDLFASDFSAAEPYA